VFLKAMTEMAKRKVTIWFIVIVVAAPSVVFGDLTDGLGAYCPFNKIRQLTEIPVQNSTFYLHGVDPALTLDGVAPPGTVAKYKDSLSVNRTAFKEIGTWTHAVPSGMTLQICPLTALRVWVGLQNSDDQRTCFDLRAELLRNGAQIASGETRNIQGVTHNPDKAKEVVLDFGPISDRYFNSGNILSLRILTKVTATGGNSSAVGLRLYYDAVSRASKLEPSSIPSCVDLGKH